MAGSQVEDQLTGLQHAAEDGTACDGSAANLDCGRRWHYRQGTEANPDCGTLASVAAANQD